MNKEEEKLLKEICEKYEVNPKYLKQLIKIEKDYTNKNTSRRVGIFKDMKELINFWTMEY